MEPGSMIFVFETKYGKIAVLNCVDAHYELIRVLKHEVDFVINPRYDVDREYAFQRKADILIDQPDGSHDHAFILQVNASKAVAGDSTGGGGTGIIGYEHKYRLNKYRSDGLRPEDEIKYKICQAKDEMMLIVDLSVGEGSKKRTKMGNWYRHDGKSWKPLKSKSIW